MTKLQNLAPVLLLALAPTAVFADDYRFEAKGAFDRDLMEGDFDFSTTTLSGTWYFDPVSTDGVPLSEAAFLGRSSYLGASVAYSEGFANVDQSAVAASVGYYIPGTMFFVGARGSRAEVVRASSSDFVLKDYETTWSGTLGIAPLDGLLITTGIGEDGYDPNITARHVGKLPNGHFYAGSVSFVNPDFGNSTFGLDFDYFLDDSTSLGAGYDDARERFELRAEKFFSPNWAAGVSAYTARFNDGFGVHVKWRY